MACRAPQLTAGELLKQEGAKLPAQTLKAAGVSLLIRLASERKRGLERLFLCGGQSDTEGWKTRPNVSLIPTLLLHTECIFNVQHFVIGLKAFDSHFGTFSLVI